MSTATPAADTSLRLGLPELFSEARFEQVLILTYGVDLEFYERVLRRHFGWFRNQIVLGDGRLLNDNVASYQDSGALRHLNRSWIAAPIRSKHAAHAKAILLAGPDDGLLLVGSGNLNLAGYARNGECFTPYRWSADRVDDLEAFLAIRDLTDGLDTQGLIDPVAADRLSVFWGAFDWWNQAPNSTGPVRHNLNKPLGEQLLAAIDREAVTELTVSTPFHDPHCAALQRLVDVLQPDSVRVLVQRDRCSVDPGRLATVLAGSAGSAHEIAAFDDDTAYLHAKILHVRTPTRDVCLTGSANCSMVALWTRHPAANLELGNLAVGPRGTFDSLFDPTVVTITGPVDPETLNVGMNPEGEVVDVDEAVLQLLGLSWTSPVLTGEISATVDNAQSIAIIVEGQQVETTISVEPSGHGWTPFRAELINNPDIAAINDVAVVTVQVADVGEASAVAYQPERLREQDRRRVDADRLRHAAQLEIDDPDLHRALVALEGILIGDNVATWAKGGSGREAAPGDDPAVTWGEINWATVRRSARHQAYGLGGNGMPGSDLGMYLEALSRATRELIDPVSNGADMAGASSSDDGDEDEFSIEGGLEGADPDEVDASQDTTRGQSASARNRRLLRNFIRRNLRALEHPDFRAGAGPGVVVLNMVILNWLCWWVSTGDEDRPGELIEERLRLWELMWGNDRAPGYLNELSPELQELTIHRFDDQRLESILLSSIVDVWSFIPKRTDEGFRRLRRILRAAIEQPCWQMTDEHVSEASALLNGRPTTMAPYDPLEVAEVLLDAICIPIDDDDARAALANAIGADPREVRVSRQSVIVATGVQNEVKEIAVECSELDTSLVQAALGAWQGAELLSYYRLRWAGGVALYRSEEANGWMYTASTDDQTDFAEIAPVSPPWTTWVLALVDELEKNESQAA